MRIGIITHYYKSTNYGGNLQAYALVKYLNSQGYNAEQISYSVYGDDKGVITKIVNALHKKEIKTALYLIKKKILFVENIIFNNKKRKHYVNTLAERNKAFYHFNRELTSHSKEIYDDESLGFSNKEYDAFITGSDQVWNLNQYREGYYLSFVDSHKKKISYAASMAMNVVSERQKKILKEKIADFDAISVREEDMVPLIREIVGNKVFNTIDPTLLLDNKEWDSVASDKLVDEAYIFCYFLGDNLEVSEKIRKIAMELNMKLVGISMANDGFKFLDTYRYDKYFDTASPENFLSLIKYAKYVFTDSFHAVIFSYIFKKDFFVFDRDNISSMNSRIEMITKLFQTEDRYISNERLKMLNNILSVTPIDYRKKNEKIDILLEQSRNFLKTALEGEL